MISPPSEHASALALIEGLAGAIRDELGDEVEACPGRRTPEHAEPLNRAFRALVRHVLEPRVPPGGDLAEEVRRVLLRVARDRLEAGGLADRQVRTLLEFEPGPPDDWLVFLILTPWHEALFRLGSGDQDPA